MSLYQIRTLLEPPENLGAGRYVVTPEQLDRLRTRRAMRREGM